MQNWHNEEKEAVHVTTSEELISAAIRGDFVIKIYGNQVHGECNEGISICLFRED